MLQTAADTYFRLVSAAAPGTTLIYSDDYVGGSCSGSSSGSQFTYTVPAGIPCQTYLLLEGTEDVT